MRVKGAIVAAVGLALLTSGCYTVEGNYLREGVGTTVPATDIVAATNLQELYFGEVCRQAGLPSIRTADGALVCDVAAMPPGAWTLFVQAGMNDIDRRCDAYLAWLDNRRRWREPILQQLHSTAAVTAAIMGLSGVGATPIAIVGAAFGFAQETFVNLSGRLITEVNHSTVQALVLTRQNDYRNGLRNRLIPNGPAALYTLRSYLRLCMPMTIEMEINTTITAVERNNVAPNRVISPTTITGAIITDATAPLQRQERQRVSTGGRQPGSVEPSVSDRTIRSYQATLCVRQDGELGPTGSATRMAIRDYIIGLTGTDPGPDALTPATRNLLNLGVNKVVDCATSPQKYETAYEVGVFGAGRGDPAVRIRDFKANLRAGLKQSPFAATIPDSADLDPKTRDAIAEYRRLNNTLLPSNSRNRQVDDRLFRDVSP